MARDDFFCSTASLAERLGDDDLAVLDATFFLPDEGRDAAAEFEAAHIPGAVFFEHDAVCDTATSLPHMLPSPDLFAAALGALGVSDTMEIVCYDSTGLRAAPRLWWMLRLHGAERVRVLDGGLPAWRAEGRPLASGRSRPQPALFVARTGFGSPVAADGVEAARTDGRTTIVDARAATRFRGDGPEPRSGVRAGHIPGSRNVPWDTLTTAGRMKEPADIRAVFEAAGVPLDDPIITSCGSGITAAILLLALASAGVSDVRLYDGSWTEWGGDASRPVATGPA